MKPHRIRMTHDLVTAYDMLDKMHVLVRSAFSVIQLKTLRTLRTLLQRPSRTSPETMTSFHTDEYIHFLNRVTPETAEELTYHGTRCEFVDVQFLRVSFIYSRDTVLVGDDNPPFEGVFEFCSISAGGSIGRYL